MSLLVKKVGFSRPKTMATEISPKVQKSQTPPLVQEIFLNNTISLTPSLKNIMTKTKVRINPQYDLYVWSTTEYNQGGKTIYVSEGEYMRAESYIPGFSDVIWIGRGRPTVRVSLGQSPPWASTKKHFYNCRVMAARCRRRIRRLATALLLHKVPVLQ